MNKKNKDNLVDPTESICPYLGLLSDPKTTTMYPIPDNACNRVSPPVPVDLHYQRICCLDPSHIDCPGYINGWQNGFPDELRGRQPKKKNLSLPKWIPFLGIGILLIALVIGALMQLSNPDDGTIAMREESLLDLTATETIVPSETPTQMPSATFTSEPSPTSTNTPMAPSTQTPGPGLQTPFGSSDLSFAVHEVLPGETIEIIARMYNTNPQVLETINQFSPPERTSLWAGDILVICVSCDDDNELPKLQALFLESKASLVELSETYNTTIDELKRWNDLGEVDYIETPRWIIVKAE